MNKKFALNFLLFASLLLVGGSIETAAQEDKAPDSKNDPVNEQLRKQREKAFEKRTAPVGVNPRGVVVPAELAPSIVKQQAKMAEMKANGFEMPLDYPGLANLVLNGGLTELPVVTETYYLDIGGMATDEPFTAFDYEKGSTALKPTDAQYATLKKLADNFNGTKFDLNDPADRKQFKIRLLRAIAPAAKTVLEELAAAYSKKFSRPLRIVSLSRSIEYQVELSKVNAGAFRVKDKDSLPAHVSGLAFDIAFKHMTAVEQNFLLTMIAKLETDGKIDGVRELGVNPVLHIFVYADGIAPKIK